MKYFLRLIAVGLVFLACTSTPPEMEAALTPTATSVPQTGEKTADPEALPAFPAIPESAERIMGSGTVTEEKLAAFLLNYNIRADDSFVNTLSGYYIEEAAIEGVNHDTAFAQMCLETGFLNYGGLVTPDMNNFCGLGAIGPEQPGLIFPDPRAGVRAHIQHLKAYASTDPLNQELIDPRFHYVKRGSSPTIHNLAGTWAADREYHIKIARILANLYGFE